MRTCNGERWQGASQWVDCDSFEFWIRTGDIVIRDDNGHVCSSVCTPESASDSPT